MDCIRHISLYYFYLYFSYQHSINLTGCSYCTNEPNKLDKLQIDMFLSIVGDQLAFCYVVTEKYFLTSMDSVLMSLESHVPICTKSS
jgi:hypothetical protein